MHCVTLLITSPFRFKYKHRITPSNSIPTSNNPSPSKSGGSSHGLTPTASSKSLSPRQASYKSLSPRMPPSRPSASSLSSASPPPSKSNSSAMTTAARNGPGLSPAAKHTYGIMGHEKGFMSNRELKDGNVDATMSSINQGQEGQAQEKTPRRLKKKPHWICSRSHD